MRNRVRVQRKPLPLPEVSLTPLIDTVLVLLVIFMVAAPIVHQAVRVELPRGKAQDSSAKREDFVVYVDRDGKLYHGKHALTEKDLMKNVAVYAAKNSDAVVYVQADQGLSYGTVVELVDRIKVVGGIKYVALATQKATTR